jgi:dTDP-4-dehydrorhamnose 3,5-epimerase
MWLNYAVPFGRIKFVLFDAREDSPTRGDFQEIFMSPENHVLVTVPPGVWNGFKGLGSEPAIVANCATMPHDPAEISRRDPHDGSIPYDWARHDG